MKKILFSVWPSFIWMVIIFFLLTISTDELNNHVDIDFFGVDKVIHFGLFFVLAFLYTIFLSNRNREFKNSIYWTMVFLISAYGLGMEFYQKYFTTRSFSLFDALFDSLGAIVGMIMAKKSPYGNRGRNQN